LGVHFTGRHMGSRREHATAEGNETGTLQHNPKWCQLCLVDFEWSWGGGGAKLVATENNIIINSNNNNNNLHCTHFENKTNEKGKKKKKMNE